MRRVPRVATAPPRGSHTPMKQKFFCVLEKMFETKTGPPKSVACSPKAVATALLKKVISCCSVVQGGKPHT